MTETRLVQVTPVEFKYGDILDKTTGEVLITRQDNWLWRRVRTETEIAFARQKGTTYLLRWEVPSDGNQLEGVPASTEVGEFKIARSDTTLVYSEINGEVKAVGPCQNLYEGRGVRLVLAHIWDDQPPF